MPSMADIKNFEGLDMRNLRLKIEVKKDGSFGKIYPESHPGWDRLIERAKLWRKIERLQNATRKSPTVE